MNFKKVIFVTFLLVCGCVAQAQERKYLDKEEVAQLLAGKVVTHLNVASGYKVKLDFRQGGMLYGNNMSASGSDSGKWDLKDDGSLCVKWKGQFTDGCYYHFKSGDKLMRTLSGEPSAPIFAEILEIK